MSRMLVTLALAGFSAAASASALMDVGVGDTLRRLLDTYPRQLVSQKAGMALFADMHDRYPAYAYFDVGALDTIVGQLWLSSGNEKGQRALFADLEKHFLDKGTTLLRDDQVVSCAALGTGRAVELHSAIKAFSDGTAVVFSQMPAFSSVSVMRGSALTPAFPLLEQESPLKLYFRDPSTSRSEARAGENRRADSPSGSMGASSYLRAWETAYRQQMAGALNTLPDLTWCAAKPVTTPLVQPVALGDAVASAPASGEGQVTVPAVLTLDSVRFAQATVQTLDGKARQVSYQLDDVTAAQSEALRSHLIQQFGPPAVSDTVKEGQSTTRRWAWTDASYRTRVMALQFRQQGDQSVGGLQLSLQPAQSPHD